MRKWTKQNSYFTYKFDNPKNNIKWFLSDYYDTDNGKHYYIYLSYVCQNIFREMITITDYLTENKMTEEEIIELNSLFENDFVKINNLNDLSDYALQILNVEPMLESQTLLAWASKDRIDDPNYYSGVYIFPDGNHYTIVLHKGELMVYPGKSDYRNKLSDILPLVSIKINLRQWADKITKDSNIIIEEING